MNFLSIALALFIAFNNYSHAQLFDHLKKAEGKSDNYKIRNIDFIYMINLDERPEKFAQASKELIRYGIHPYRFSAVNGWKLSLEVINDIGLKYLPGMTPLLATTFPLEAGGLQSHEFMKEFGKTYFCHCMAQGAMGCAMSHISVLKDAWDAGYETIWVLEDDIQVVQDPTIIPDLIDRLDALVGKGNWDVLFTDQNYRRAEGQYVVASGASKRPDMDCSVQARYNEKYTINQDISADFRRVSARFGTHSMIIRRSGIRKLLEFANAQKIYFPYDLDNYLHHDIKRYSFTFDMVTNMINAISDIGGPNYLEKGS